MIEPDGVSKSFLFDVETDEKVWPDDAPQIIYRGDTYACWFFEGCVGYLEVTEDTLKIYLGTREKEDAWPDIITLKRISATEMIVIESTGEGQVYFAVQAGCVFTHQSDT